MVQRLEIVAILSLEDLLQEELLVALCHSDAPTTGNNFFKILQVISCFQKEDNDDPSSGRPITIEGGGTT